MLLQFGVLNFFLTKWKAFYFTLSVPYENEEDKMKYSANECIDYEIHSKIVFLLAVLQAGVIGIKP